MSMENCDSLKHATLHRTSIGNDLIKHHQQRSVIPLENLSIEKYFQNGFAERRYRRHRSRGTKIAQECA
ncbi:hypothetical protein BIW11_04703 [Tropilaelaps mercedesae]|uniref:Uncharacterized protein n=1 Tax=Tropilaelaps mercedesae TaxID=418985 RepID=A0A1V9X2Z2_9ACAR|nr:hypothetical protein BIW11_04703 [Tropilaelaps mercedesae]